MSFEPNDLPYEDEDGVIQYPGMTPDEPPDEDDEDEDEDDDDEEEL